MQLHLNEISQAVGDNVQIALVVDGAGWHRAENLSIPSNISLLFLPPYSPELNPIERLWLWLKEKQLSNRTFADLNAIIDAGVSAWRTLDSEVVISVCNADGILPLSYLNQNS